MDRSRFFALSCICLLLGTAALARSSSSSFAAYPGAKYLKDQSQEYREQEDAQKAYVYRVKASFRNVVRFYRKRYSEGALAESESTNLYLVVTRKLKVTVEPGKGGWVWIRAAVKPVKSEGTEGEGSPPPAVEGGQGEDGQTPAPKPKPKPRAPVIPFPSGGPSKPAG